MRTAFGHALGVVVYAVFVVFGISIFFESYSFIYLIIKILGVIFLFWLGLTSFKLGRKENVINISSDIKSIQFKGLLDGFLLSLLNPKIVIWFLALYSQFLDFSPSFFQKIILVLIPFLVDFFWYLVVAYLVSKISFFKYLHILNFVSGVLLMGISIVLFGYLLLY